MNTVDELTKRPTPRQIHRWRRYLANERAEAALYREIAHKKTGEERDILLKLAQAESRHEAYWHDKLGEYVGMPRRPSFGTRVLGFLANRFGSVFVLAMMQSAETRTPYLTDDDAPDQIAADEAIHSEVVRGLAAQGRATMSGSFRAAVFGANDGLVSNLALVLGVMGSGVAPNIILITGISGLLAGALSMAAGEYISVKSQSELLEASTPQSEAYDMAGLLDVNANELALVYRARGMSEEEADAKARAVLAKLKEDQSPSASHVLPVTTSVADGRDTPTGSTAAWAAAISSLLCFGSGALIPVLPFILGASASTGALVALALVAVALMITGGITGILSGKPPLYRAFRQLVIGMTAAVVTWGLGALFGVAAG